MPMPNWVAKVNKRLFNKIELKRGKRPVLTHTGRSSGRAYEVPLDAHKVEGGYIFILMYGSSSDWVRNVMTAGTARLRIDNDTTELSTPRLLDKDTAIELLPASVKLPPGILGVSEFLMMETQPEPSN